MSATMTNNNIHPQAKEVGKELLNIGAVQINVANPFTWVSGIQSPIYCNNRIILSHVDVRKRIVDFFISAIENEYPDVEIIAGVATGGMPFAALIADRMNLPFIYVRQAPKEHGLMKQVEGDFNQGDKVVLIEDHISTGGSSLKAIKGLKDAGLELLCLMSIMTYSFKVANQSFEENDVNYLSLCDLDTVLNVLYDNGKLSDQDKTSVISFKQNPEKWGK